MENKQNLSRRTQSDSLLSFVTAVGKAEVQPCVDGLRERQIFAAKEVQEWLLEEKAISNKNNDGKYISADITNAPEKMNLGTLKLRSACRRAFPSESAQNQPVKHCHTWLSFLDLLRGEVEDTSRYC